MEEAGTFVVFRPERTRVRSVASMIHQYRLMHQDFPMNGDFFEICSPADFRQKTGAGNAHTPASAALLRPASLQFVPWASALLDSGSRSLTMRPARWPRRMEFDDTAFTSLRRE